MVRKPAIDLAGRPLSFSDLEDAFLRITGLSLSLFTVKTVNTVNLRNEANVASGTEVSLAYPRSELHRILDVLADLGVLPPDEIQDGGLLCWDSPSGVRRMKAKPKASPEDEDGTFHFEVTMHGSRELMVWDALASPESLEYYVERIKVGEYDKRYVMRLGE